MTNLQAVPVKTTSYKVHPDELVPVNATPGVVTVFLPASPVNGTQVSVVKVDTTVNAVSVAASGADAFAGGTVVKSLTLAGQSLVGLYASGVWYLLSDDSSLATLDARYATIAEPSSGLKNFYPGAFPNWAAAVATARAGGAPARISVYGDSQSNGYMAADGTDYTRCAAYRAMLGLDLNWMTTALGLCFPRASATNGTFSGADPRFTLGTGWTAFLAQQQGPASVGSLAGAFNAAGALTFTADRCDSFTVYAAQFTGSATVGVSIDGEAVTTMNLAVGGPLLAAITVSTATVGTHTVSVTCSGASGHNYIEAIEPFDSTRPGIRVSMFGRNSAGSATWLPDSGAAWDNNGMALTAANPALVIYAIGTNDHTGATPQATFRSNVSTWVARAQASGADVILQVPAAGGGGDPATWADYRDSLLTVAKTLGCGLIDIQARWGNLPYTVTNAAPYLYWADVDHHSARGYASNGLALAEAIRLATW